MPNANEAIWTDVLKDLTGLSATAKAGGMAAVKKKYKVTRLPAGPAALTREVIVAARKGTGLSQRLFAAGLGVSVQLVRGWEQGKKTPTPAVRLLLADMAERPGHWKAKLAVADK